MVLALIIAAVVGGSILSDQKISRNKKIGYVAGTVGISLFFTAATYLLLTQPKPETT